MRSATTGAAHRIRFVSIAGGLWGAEESLLTIARHLPAHVEAELWATSPALRARWESEVGTPARRLQRGRSRLQRTMRAVPAVVTAPRGSAVVLWDVDLLLLAALLWPLMRIRHVRVYLDLHVTLSGRRGALLLRLLARALTGCMTISGFTARQVDGATKTVVVQRPILGQSTVAPEAASTDATPGSAAVDGYVVGIIGRIDPEKGVHEAVRACADVPAVRRVIVRGAPFEGDATYLATVLEAGQAIQPTEFEYGGRTSAHEVMAGIDVLLHWNPKEPAGRVVQEAQLAGLVAVVPDDGGAREFVQDGVTGVVYRACDPGDLRRVLSRLEDPRLRAAIGSSASVMARERYDPRRQAARYASIIAGGSRRDRS